MFTEILSAVIRRLQNLKSFFSLKLFFYSYYSNVFNEYTKLYNQKKTIKLFFIWGKKKLPKYFKKRKYLTTIKENSADIAPGHNFLQTCLTFRL